MIKGLAAIIAMIAGVIMWACGVGFSVSIIALVLKWCGVGFLTGMSSWLPVKFLGGWIASMFVTAASTSIALSTLG